MGRGRAREVMGEQAGRAGGIGGEGGGGWGGGISK